MVSMDYSSSFRFMIWPELILFQSSTSFLMHPVWGHWSGWGNLAGVGREERAEGGEEEAGGVLQFPQGSPCCWQGSNGGPPLPEYQPTVVASFN